VAFLFHSVVLQATYIEKKIGKTGLEKDEGQTYFFAFVDLLPKPVENSHVPFLDCSFSFFFSYFYHLENWLF